jgi:YD repeat-containing protein
MATRKILRCKLAAAAVLLVTTASGAHAASTVPVLKIVPIIWPRDIGNKAKLGSLVFRGGLTLSTADGKFHGFSGLWVSSDGKQLAGVENGGWMTARLTYDRAGNLSGMVPTDAGPLHDEQGKPFTAEDDEDAEALDFDGTRFLVGFETNDRVLAYKNFKGQAERIQLPPEALAGILRGTGFSSVAALKGGGTVFLPEYSGGEPYVRGSPRRGWLRLPDGTAGAFWLHATAGWLPVSLATLPDGDLLLAEIHIAASDTEADQARISRIRRAKLQVDATVDAEELAILAAPIPSARIEGMSIRSGKGREVLVYMMATTAPSQLYMFSLKPR